MRRAGYIKLMGEMRNAKKNIYIYIFWLKNLKERVHAEDLGVNGKRILEGILGT